MHPETGPSAGKFFKIEHAKGKVIFNPQTKTIYSVELK
jgi:hypothetical protein